MRILIADDHALFAEGLHNLLQAGGYTVVGLACDGREALQLARRLKPDLILMDVRMPKCDGVAATRLIKAELPEIQIVMLTTSAEQSDLFDAIKSGANGYLLKNLKPDVLFSYLSGLTQGQAPLSRELAVYVLKEFTQQAASLDDQQRKQNERKDGCGDVLTARQAEVLELVASGLSYKEVGAVLHISENTVKYHMGEILRCLHLKNREQVIAYAVSTGLVDVTPFTS